MSIRRPWLAMVALYHMLLWASPASAVDISWVIVGDPGNPADTEVMIDGTSGYGSVDYLYRISRYEVTNAQYAEFLNAVADADPNGLYSTAMDTTVIGGIVRSGASGSFGYNPKAGFENKPVVFASFHDALRFTNWLQNGQPEGPQGPATTEDGAYTITPAGIAANSITRNPGATIFVTSEDEWYKAAYYDALSASYFDYPAGTDAKTACAAPGPGANQANCNSEVIFGIPTLTDVGSYTGSASPAGTFDQGGTLFEWTESIVGFVRAVRGGAFSSLPASSELSSAFRLNVAGPDDDLIVGFRVASLVPVPEPVASVLVTTGLLGIASWRRRRCLSVA